MRDRATLRAKSRGARTAIALGLTLLAGAALAETEDQAIERLVNAWGIESARDHLCDAERHGCEALRGEMEQIERGDR